MLFLWFAQTQIAPLKGFFSTQLIDFPKLLSYCDSSVLPFNSTVQSVILQLRKHPLSVDCERLGSGTGCCWWNEGGSVRHVQARPRPQGAVVSVARGSRAAHVRTEGMQVRHTAPTLSPSRCLRLSLINGCRRRWGKTKLQGAQKSTIYPHLL